MDTTSKQILWGQFGAAIDMLENALRACPEPLWSDRARQPEYWYVVYHTLFWLDFYLSAPAPGFAPPAPFGLEELDPEGLLPERPYTKAELSAYLEHGRRKCRESIASLTDATARRRYVRGTLDLSITELLLYNMRHVQHHAAQLNLILRHTTDSAPRWVTRAALGLDGD